LIGATTYATIKRKIKLLYWFAALHFFCFAPLTSLFCASSARIAKKELND